MNCLPFRRMSPNGRADDVYVVPSRSSNNEHEVMFNKDRKRWECSCPHFVFRLRKTGTHCHHIKKLLVDIEEHRKMCEALEAMDWSLAWDDEVEMIDEDNILVT